jgi:hypothetical protein
LAALHSPEFFEIEDLPPGLAVDPQVPGRVTGRPTAGGTFAVTLRALNASGETTATLQLDIASSSFAAWSGEAAGAPPSSPAVLAAYAVGAAAGPDSPGEPAFAQIDGGYLVLSALVRTDDPDLVVTGLAVDDLADFGGPSEVTVPGERAADQTGVPEGHEHRLFRVPAGSSDRKFLRLRIEHGP